MVFPQMSFVNVSECHNQSQTGIRKDRIRDHKFLSTRHQLPQGLIQIYPCGLLQCRWLSHVQRLHRRGDAGRLQAEFSIAQLLQEGVQGRA